MDSSDPIQLDSGVCSFTGKGSGYNTDVCYWQVTKYDDVTHDGIREIQFDAVCYIPDSSIPYFGQTYDTYISSELYDAYTGTWLTASTAPREIRAGPTTTIITRCTGTTALTTLSSSFPPTGT